MIWRTNSVSIVALVAVAASLALTSATADEVDDLNTKVGELSREGRYPEASAVAQTAADKARALHGEASRAYARALSWQGYLLQVRGKADAAEALFEKSLDIYQKILPAGHPDIATSINNLGFSYQNSDRLIESEQMYKRALDMREKAKPAEPLMIADSLNNLAQCYKRQGRIAEAEPLLQRALTLRRANLPENDPLIAQSLTNIGSTMELQEKFADAETRYREALAIRRKSQPADHPDIAGSLNKLAELLFKRGRYAEAESIFRDVIEQRYRTQPAGHIDIATSLVNRSENLIELKNFADAKSGFRNALAIQQMALPPLHPAIARTQAGLGRIAKLEGDGAQALSYYRVAAITQAARGRSDEIARQHFYQFVGVAYDAVEASRTVPDQTLVNQALEMAQRAALTETAATVTRMAARFSSTDPALRDMMRDSEEIEADIARGELELSASLARPVEERTRSVDAQRQTLTDLAAQRSKITADLKTRFPLYANLIAPDPLSLSDVRGLLKPDEALVYYFSGTDGMYVWAITQEGSQWRRLTRPTASITDAVSKLRATLDISTMTSQGTRPKLFDLGLAHDLYQSLLGPVETLIEGKANTIVIPSGPLTSLPFQMLVKSNPTVKQPGLAQLAVYRETDWLMNHTALSVMPALSSLRAMRTTSNRPDSTKPMIGFGNPVFDASLKPPPVEPVPERPAASQASLKSAPATPSTRPLTYASFWRGPAADPEALRSGLPALPETEAELRYVANKLHAPDTDLRLGAAATEAAVKTMDLTKYKVVYFATHGLVAGEVKGLGEPALALSLPAVPSALDDGLLTASEVAQLKLNADWVILSACNTADPRSAGAEALSGLAKSFFHAGARALLVSHWRVGSDATTRITTGTFDYMAAHPTAGRAEALRQAMRTFLADTSDPWNAYPTFWAPFVVVGEGRL